MAKTIKRFNVLDRQGDRHEHLNIERPVHSSNVDLIVANLLKAIADKNEMDFAKTLADDYIYAGCLKTEESNVKANNEWWYSKHEYYHARPRLEVLLFEHPAKLLAVVKALTELNDEHFYAEFLRALKEADISEDIFSWTPAIRQQVNMQLQQVSLYGEKLHRQYECKGAVIKQLYDELVVMVYNHFSDGEKNDVKFNNLRFKLELAEKLQSKDAELSVQRGWKRIVGNIVLGLFTAGAALLIHRLAYGEWLFFNKTTSQEKIAEVQRAVMPRLGSAP